MQNMYFNSLKNIQVIVCSKLNLKNVFRWPNKHDRPAYQLINLVKLVTPPAISVAPVMMSPGVCIGIQRMMMMMMSV